MLDAYIIDRIRRERERAQRDGAQAPLYIERTPPPVRREERPEKEKEPQDRGSVVVDFRV